MSTIFIAFITIFFLVFFTLNYYVFRRARQALVLYPKTKKYFSWGFWVLPTSLIAGRILENWFINIFSAALIWVGSIWLGALTYFVLFCAVLDFFRLIIKIFKINLPWLTLDEKRKFKLGIVVVIFVSLITIGGSINAFFPVTRTIDIDIPKKSLSKNHTVRMIVASDIHLGTLVGKRRFNKLVETINNIKPDVVIFPGDIVDEDILPVIKEDMGASLSQIKPPLGFFGITGNHEYIGGVESSVEYLSSHGIRILRDEAILVGDSFYLVGREDLSLESMGGKTRKTLDELFAEVPENAPVVLLDHQPFRLKSVAEFGKVDLQISGHTHRGQIWPFNYIVEIIYEIAYGYGKIGDTQFYVSNGYGTWGPPLRVGNRPEIVVINLSFDK